MRKISAYFIFLFFLPGAFFPQKGVDSLLRVLESCKTDTARVNTLLLIAMRYGSNDPARALEYANKAAVICESPDYDTTRADFLKVASHAFRSQGVSDYFLGDYTRALQTLQRSLTLSEKINDKEGTATAYNWIGYTHYSRGSLQKATEAMLRSLKLQEETGNKPGAAGSMNGIANVYRAQHNLKKALEYYFKSLNIRMELNDSVHGAYTYNNIGLVYAEMDSLDKSLYYHFKCLRIVQSHDDKKGMANSYGNIGEVYSQQKKYHDALANLTKSMHISEQISDKNGICASYNDIGKIYLKVSDFKNAITSFDSALAIGLEIEDRDAQKDCYSGIASAYYAIGKYEDATFNLERYIEVKDSLASDGNSRNLEEMQARFETEKKEQEIQLLHKDKSIRDLQLSEQASNINRQRILIYSVVGGLAIIVFLIFFIFKSYRQKKKINVGLERKNIEINIQKDQIEKKNVLITDSIEYARSIQNAILPTDEIIAKCIPDSCILFLPKDIVSGDLYWLHQKDDKVLLAAIDCTGHGVPGAFMSVMAYNMLENIVSDKNVTQPSLILDELNKTVIETLPQESETSSAKYGMDISLVELDRKNGKLRFAGAHNSLYIVRPDQTIAELKANNATIGMALEKFTHHEADIKKGDTLYMFTDGYPDQRGGPQNKKFFSAELRKLLLSISTKTCAEQKEILHQSFLNWRGTNEQIDDILVIGMKV